MWDASSVGPRFWRPMPPLEVEAPALAGKNADDAIEQRPRRRDGAECQVRFDCCEVESTID